MWSSTAAHPAGLVLLLSSCLVALTAASTPQNQCPPAGFDSVPNFDVAAYASASWYVQAQIPLIYQQKSQLYCVKATYKPINASDPADGLYVYNYANQGSVNGPSMGTTEKDDFVMVALPSSRPTKPVSLKDTASALQNQASSFLDKIKNSFSFGDTVTKQDSSAGGASPNAATAASKLDVGPKALSDSSLVQAVTFGPYWVVAVGESTVLGDNKYKWAVVSGGPPVYPTGSGCTTFMPLLPTTLQYTGGLWIFTRQPVDAASKAEALAAIKGLGFDASKLVDVQQEGCLYKGAMR